MTPFPSAFRLLACAALVTSGLRAQTAPATPAGFASPPRHAHTHNTTVTLDQFLVSATPFAGNQVDVAQATTVLSGRSLLLKQQATLGETLSSETGIAASSFGPGASRPIIRGLGGDRIRLLENGVGTLDASVNSPDHAVSVEPFLIERIEVLRGPAALLYGSNAVGGAVNVITHRIETELPTERIRGAVELRGGSAAEELARGAVVDIALEAGADRALVLHFDAFRREAENVRIPGYAESARIRAEEAEEAAEHGEALADAARGRLPNSSLSAQSGSAGLSFVGKNFYLGASLSGFETNYGLPGHAHEEHAEGDEHDENEAASESEAEGVRVDLRQRRTDVQGEWRADAGLINAVRFKFGHARYRHAEREPDGEIGTLFTNKGYDGRVEVLHGGPENWRGAIGAHATRSDFSAAGEEAFVPPSLTQTQALFAFEEVSAGPLTWQFGARLERSKISAEGNKSRRSTEPSGSVGAVWKRDEATSIALSVAHTSRAANAQELFADGPHAGTQAYEIGDANLKAERSLGVDLSLRRHAGLVTGAITLFANRFQGFIFEQPTGLLAIEHDGAWEFLEADDEHADEEEGLPLYRTVQRDARFWGVEVETIWHLHDKSDWQLDLRLAADLTRAREGGRNLPRIPAARTTAGLLWGTANWSAGAECQWVHDQNRIAGNETRSDGYALVNAHVSRAFTTGHWRTEVFVRGTNLANEEARPHSSFVKELAPLAGRSVVAGIRLTF